MTLHDKYDAILSEFNIPNELHKQSTLQESCYKILDKSVVNKTHSTLTISSWNANGLHNYQKFSALQMLMTLADTSIQVIVETHLNDVNATLYTLPNFNSVFRGRKKSLNGERVGYWYS